MINSAMKRLLDSGECLDIAKIGVEQPDGTFLLNEFVDGAEYCHAPSERWVWSIGEKNGKFFAAFDVRLYGNSEYKCVWLR